MPFAVSGGMKPPFDPERIFAVVTCEHATMHVPAAFGHLRIPAELLESHRGWDPGALDVAFRWSRELNAPLFRGLITRLLVDLNRSAGHPHWTAPELPVVDDELQSRLMWYYRDLYREPCRQMIDSAVGRGMTVIHLSIHSFTPVLDGVKRDVEAGILFDPAREPERILCESWISECLRIRQDVRLMANRPYLGIDDGMTTWLRTIFPPEVYLGIEVEISQKYVGRGLEDVSSWLLDGLRRVAGWRTCG